MADEKKPGYSSVWTVGVTPSGKTAKKPSSGSAGSSRGPASTPSETVRPPRKPSERDMSASKPAYADVDDGWADEDLDSTSAGGVPPVSRKPDRKPTRTRPDVDPAAEAARLERERLKAEEARRREAERLERERKRTEERAAAEKAAARAAAMPCRNGYCGRVSKLEDMHEDSIPGKLTRWFTALFTGDPYSPSNKGCSFFLTPDDPEGSTLVVRAYGDLRLANGQHLCIKGRLQDKNSLVAQRIWWDTRADSMSRMDEDYEPDWAPLADSRAQSAASLRLLVILGIVLGIFLINVLFNGLVLPLFGWLAVEGPSLIVMLIFIVIGVNWLRNSFRRFFR